MWRRFAFIALVVLGALLMTRVVMQLGTIRGPYPVFGKSLAWMLGTPEPAYNSAAVERGRIYRSARPDARFLEWLGRTRGVRRVIGLAGSDPVHEIARQLGMEVTAFTWQPSRLPPREELDAVLELLSGGEPVLVHCASGSDRTGYAIAAYRVERMNWTIEDAVKEMRAYWHDSERHPDLHRALRARFERFTHEGPRSEQDSELFVASEAWHDPGRQRRWAARTLCCTRAAHDRGDSRPISPWRIRGVLLAFEIDRGTPLFGFRVA